MVRSPPLRPAVPEAVPAGVALSPTAGNRGGGDDDADGPLVNNAAHPEPSMATTQPLMDKSQLKMRWVIMVFICFALTGDFYLYDNPAALKTQLRSMFSSQMSESAFETRFQLMYSMYAFPNIILPFFGGILVDKFGTRITLFGFCVAITCSACIVALGASIKSIWVMLIGRVVFGFFGEVLTVAQDAILCEWFKGRELAFSFGITLSFCRAGSVLNNYLSPYLADSGGVAWALWFAVLLQCGSLVATVGVGALDIRAEKMLRVINKGRGDGSPEKEGGGHGIPLRDIPKAVKIFPRSFWIMVLSCLAVYSVVQVFNNTAQTFLLERDYFTETPSLDECCCWGSGDDQCYSAWPPGAGGDGVDSTHWHEQFHSASAGYDKTCRLGCPFGKHVAPAINLTKDQLSHLDCNHDTFSNGSTDPFYGLSGDGGHDGEWGYNVPPIPSAGTEPVPYLKHFCDKQTDALLKAGLIMSIPYYVNIALSPFLGILVDRFGRCGWMLLVTPAMMCAAHMMLGKTTMNPIYPLALQGVAYSFYAAALWPPVAYLIEARLVGTAYGFLTAAVDTGTAVFPFVTAAIYNGSNHKYVPNTEYLWASLAAFATLCGVWLNFEDSINGWVLNRSHWNDGEEEDEETTEGKDVTQKSGEYTQLPVEDPVEDHVSPTRSRQSRASRASQASSSRRFAHR